MTLSTPDERKAQALIKRVQSLNYRARQKGVEGKLTVDDIEEQYAMQGGKCWWCHVEVGQRYHVDHIIPVVIGGPNTRDNIVIACPSCNRRKRDKSVADFLANIPQKRQRKTRQERQEQKKRREERERRLYTTDNTSAQLREIILNPRAPQRDYHPIYEWWIGYMVNSVRPRKKPRRR